MPLYDPKVKLREGDRIVTDDKYFEIEELLDPDKVKIYHRDTGVYEVKHIDWFDNITRRSEELAIFR